MYTLVYTYCIITVTKQKNTSLPFLVIINPGLRTFCVSGRTPLCPVYFTRFHVFEFHYCFFFFIYIYLSTRFKNKHAPGRSPLFLFPHTPTEHLFGLFVIQKHKIYHNTAPKISKHYRTQHNIKLHLCVHIRI